MHVSWTDVGTFLDDKINNFWRHKIANGDVALEERRQGLLAWSGVRLVSAFGIIIAHLHDLQIAKALILRNHPLSSRYTDVLFEVLGDSSIGWDAAKTIGGLASLDAILTRKHHAIIKVRILETYTSYLHLFTTIGRFSMRRSLSTGFYHVSLTVSRIRQVRHVDVL